eukprot:4578874-Prymnesium_polylepis.1
MTTVWAERCGRSSNSVRLTSLRKRCVQRSARRAASPPNSWSARGCAPAQRTRRWLLPPQPPSTAPRRLSA